MNQTVPEMVRIGVANAQIKCVTPQRVEYFDEAEQECFIALEECARSWVQLHNQNEDDLVLLTSEDKAGRRTEFHVARRGSHADSPEWIEFTNKRHTRFEFRSYKEAYNTLLQPLRKAGWYTQITRVMKP